MTAYFPEGVWYDIYQLTPVTKSGKTSINLNAPLDTIPVRTAFLHCTASLHVTRPPLYSTCVPVPSCQLLVLIARFCPTSLCHPVTFTLLSCHLHSVILSPSLCHPVTFTLSSCHLHYVHCHSCSQVHYRGGSIIPMQTPENTTAVTRTTNFTLCVALDNSSSASGDLYVDDGISLQPTQ